MKKPKQKKGTLSTKKKKLVLSKRHAAIMKDFILSTIFKKVID